MSETRDFWRNRPVFVTGSTGFLGRWIVARLIGIGADVTCLVRNIRPVANLNRIVFGDIRDQQLIERAICEGQCKTVFHLAAQAQVCVANSNPISTWETNVRGTWSVLEACRHCPCVEQIVVSSSDKAYGDQQKLPYTEDMPLLGVNPYDASKASSDRIAQTYAKTFGLPVAITRLGNLFGGGDKTWSRLVPGTIRRLLNGARPVIHGDGRMVRDWLYVEDAVDAYLMLAELKAPMAYNFSMETPLSIIEVVRAITDATGVDMEPIVGMPQIGEIQAQSLDCTKARSVLGWRPRHTFEQGMAKTVAWYKGNL